MANIKEFDPEFFNRDTVSVLITRRKLDES